MSGGRNPRRWAISSNHPVVPLLPWTHWTTMKTMVVCLYGETLILWLLGLSFHMIKSLLLPFLKNCSKERAQCTSGNTNGWSHHVPTGKTRIPITTRLFFGRVLSLFTRTHFGPSGTTGDGCFKKGSFLGE